MGVADCPLAAGRSEEPGVPTHWRSSGLLKEHGGEDVDGGNNLGCPLRTDEHTTVPSGIGGFTSYHTRRMRDTFSR